MHLSTSCGRLLGDHLCDDFSDSDFPEDFIELGASQQKAIVKEILQVVP